MYKWQPAINLQITQTTRQVQLCLWQYFTLNTTTNNRKLFHRCTRLIIILIMKAQEERKKKTENKHNKQQQKRLQWIYNKTPRHTFDSDTQRHTNIASLLNCLFTSASTQPMDLHGVSTYTADLTHNALLLLATCITTMSYLRVALLRANKWSVWITASQLMSIRVPTFSTDGTEWQAHLLVVK